PKMVSKPTFTSRKQSGFLLAEALVAVGVTSLLVLAICAFTMFSGHSFAALFNYVDLDDANRICMDQLTRDIRQANKVNSFATNQLVLDTGAGSSVSYTYDSVARNLTRRTLPDNASKVVLHDCDRFAFRVCKRPPIQYKYDLYDVTTTINTAKVIDVSWLCSRTIFGRKENTESVQTARIVIRKQ